MSFDNSKSEENVSAMQSDNSTELSLTEAVLETPIAESIESENYWDTPKNVEGQDIEDFDIARRKTIAAWCAFPVMLLISIITMVPILVIHGMQAGLDWLVDPANIMYALITTQISLILTVVWALFYTKQTKNWKDALLLKKAKLKWYFISGGIGIAMFGFLQGLNWILNNFFNRTLESSDTSVAVTTQGGVQGFILMWLMVPIIVPFIEELFFRGYFYNFVATGSYSQKRKSSFVNITNEKGWTTTVKKIEVVGKRLLFSNLLAVFSSAIFFGLMHTQDTTFNGLMLVGFISFYAIIKGFLVWKIQSIWPLFIGHLAYNGITMVFSLIFTLS